MEFFLDGKSLLNWDETVTLFTATESNTFSYETVSGRVVRPDQDIVILSLLATEMPLDSLAEIQNALDSGRLTSRVCYCSVFDECWLLVSESRTPTPAETCPKSTSEF